MTRLLTVLALVLLVALGGCGSVQNKHMTVRDKQLRAYSSAIRWSEFETAWGMVDPAYRAEHPLTDLEIERYKQVQVTNYTERNRVEEPDGSVSQVVDILLINRNTQVERAIVDHQRWVFDAATGHWWLATGLPEFQQRP
jgi:uncharacterized protein YceK